MLRNSIVSNEDFQIAKFSKAVSWEISICENKIGFWEITCSNTEQNLRKKEGKRAEKNFTDVISWKNENLCKIGNLIPSFDI